MLKIWSSLASSTADFFLRRGTKRPRLADSEEAEATATTMARAATAAPAAVSANDTVLASIESSAPQSKVNNCDDDDAAAAFAEKNTTRPNQAFLSNGVFSDADSAKEDNSSLCGDDYLTDDDDDDEQFAESVSKLAAFQKTIRNVVDETRDSSGSESETDLKSQQKKRKHSESEMTSANNLDESIRVLSKSLMDTPNTNDTAAATSRPSTSVISLLAFRKQPRTSTTTTTTTATTAFNSTTSTAKKTSIKTVSTVATSTKSAAAAFSSTYNGPINLPYRCTITAKKEDMIAKQGCKMRLKEDLLKGPLLEICRKQPIYALDPPRTRSRVKQDSSGDQAGNEVAEAARTTTMKATGVTKAFHKVKMMKVRPKGANGSIEKELIPAPKDAKEKDVNSYEVTKDNNSSRNNNNNNNNEKVKVGRSGLRNGNNKISSDNGKDVKKSRKRKANPSF